MVLRSGKRRSLTDVKKINDHHEKETPQSPQKETDPDLEMVPGSDGDDEAPEAVGFFQAKKAALDDLRREKRQVLADKARRKAERKRRAERDRAQKERKRLKKGAAATTAATTAAEELPMEVLEKAKEEEAERQNKVKRLDEADQGDDEGEVSFSPTMLKREESWSGRLKAVTPRDERALHQVPPHVANFKRDMLFGGRIRREDVKTALRRRDKVRQCGIDVRARL